MARRLVEQKIAIKEYAFQKEDLSLPLVNSDWAVLEELISGFWNFILVFHGLFNFLVLEPAEQVSNSLSKSPISTVLPYARAFYDQLYSMPLAERAVDAVRTKLIEGIERRFLGLKEERLERKPKIIITYFFRIYCLSTLLDPRYKDRNAEIFRAKTLEWLKESHQNNVEIELSEPINFLAPGHSPPAKRRESFFDKLDYIATAEAQQDNNFLKLIE